MYTSGLTAKTFSVCLHKGGQAGGRGREVKMRIPGVHYNLLLLATSPCRMQVIQLPDTSGVELRSYDVGHHHREPTGEDKGCW